MKLDLSIELSLENLADINNVWEEDSQHEETGITFEEHLQDIVNKETEKYLKIAKRRNSLL